MDTDGRYGNRRVNKEHIDSVIRKSHYQIRSNYLLQMPLKSLDYNDMVLIPELESLSLEDACATLTFTAETVSIVWIYCRSIVLYNSLNFGY